MANNDLEKYAKALDRFVDRVPLTRTLIPPSAIMKYHSLKMEEVNETMRHLWNKTYLTTEANLLTWRMTNPTNLIIRIYPLPPHHVREQNHQC